MTTWNIYIYPMNNQLNNNFQYELFQDAIKCGILKTDSVRDLVMKKKIEQIKEIHPFAITPPSEKTPRWQTYFKADGKRQCIKAKTEDELWKKLIPLYHSTSHLEKMTFYGLYQEWIEYKKTITNSANTIKRHEQHYRKYFEPSVLHDKKISQINDLLLEKVSNEIVKSHNISRKEWGNIRTILNGMFDYALRKKYIPENPMENVRIYVKFRQVNKKTGTTQTYNTDELKNLNKYLDDMYHETDDTVFLAVKLNFLLGLRVAELVTLKWQDVESAQLHIVREEIRDQTTNTVSVVEHTKTNTDRFVILVPKAAAILKQIEPSGNEYIFTRNGERITARQVAYVLEKYAERQGVATKSTHKMRKTYASNLATSGVPLDCIREQLGHTNLSTTLSYIYNPLTETETYSLFCNAL